MSWHVIETGRQLEKTVDFGNKFLIGNGYLGYRGTMEEYGKEELVACNLAGIYDQRGSAWREPINAPNGFYTQLFIDNQAMDLRTSEVITHSQELDMQRAVHQRKTVFAEKVGEVTIESERFASSTDNHLLHMRYSFSLEKTARVRLVTGIDGDIWDINGPHLFDYDEYSEGQTIAVSAVSGELKHKIAVADTISRTFEAEEQLLETEKGVFRQLDFTAQAGVVYQLTKSVAIYTSQDTKEPLDEAVKASFSANQFGYEVLKQAHEAEWQNRWSLSDVEIEGDDEAQLALRYSIYQLLLTAPYHGQTTSIPARGLSGQTYKGAIFWDTEMFMLPFFLYTAPETAKNLIDYRIKTLNGARDKAKEYGFRGAFYAWESQESGQDACSDYNVTDVFTNRPMRTYFRDKQIHISAAVACGIWQTYLMTEDLNLLINGGAEVILECARFYNSYAYYRPEKERFELIDVIGPDEYHERVYNNAYTNKMAAYTIDIAIQALERLEADPTKREELIRKLDYQRDMEQLQTLKEGLYVPKPNEQTGLIEQFDGYFDLEDTTVETVRSRLLDPKEYWGGAYGVAADTQILKQADVVLLLTLFKDEYSKEVKKRNWQYYEPRTEHGSSLSPCIYALLACDIGDPEWAYPYFMKTASVDLTGASKQFAGTIYIGGTHPAANGGAWMAAVLGFAGLEIKDGEISVNPKLPEKWQKMSFSIQLKQEIYRIEVTKEGGSVWKQ
ncbi:glycoside hydrolase family 65 protein [Enterococcus sp. BWR-S5]|uniref:glycoside hydrolase family 65 protein n=1 Tax=Enterococcus sp. BWR-S5 TaxID=2787714 RepID=UPI001924ADF4|nr:glycoside hydrolase family 65 protein [Enterococcus sp. BWR-S5]MBL1223937.1 glycoside hydrolase family 65 protein [Enterococcus sp. BWR-S5]